MNPVLIISAAWLLVIGYGLVYIGWANLGGKNVSFSQAFLGGALSASKKPASPTGSTAQA